MKKKLIGFLISALLIINVLPIVLTAEDEFYINERMASVVFSEPEINKEGQYIILNILESSSFLMEPGKPMLPIYSKTFILPFGTIIKNVDCNPSQIEQKSITKEIKPSPKPVLLDFNTKTGNKNNELFKDEIVYNSDEYFPYSWFDYNVGCGLEGSDHVVFLTLRCYPVRYSPGQNIIQYTKNVDIKIEFYEPIYPAVFNDKYDMVVIAPSEFLDDLQPLKEYKDESGRATILVSLDDIFDGTYFAVEGRDDQEKIKYFIKNALEEWNIECVLLAGGENYIPVRISHVPDRYEDSFISDLYYADIYRGSSIFCSWDYNDNDIFGEFDDDLGNIDRVDLRPDVQLGRLNFRGLNEVSGVVNKIITYETTGSYMEEWFSNMVLCGGDTFPPPVDSSGVPEGEYLNEEALDLMEGFEDDKIWATNKKVKWSVNIDNAVENGSGFIHMTGHGTPDCWTTHPHNDENTWWPIGTYLNLYVANLKNSDELPVIIIGGCSNCQFSEIPCFGWTWVKNPNGGAIASYGNSALGLGYPGSSCSQGLTGAMELSGFKAYGVQNAKTTGDLWVKALNNYRSYYFNSGFYADYKTLEEWVSFSDPSLRIAKVSEKPNKPDKPEGPSSGEIETEYTFKSRTTDPDGDLIKYCFDWGDNSITWTDWMNSGENMKKLEEAHIKKH